MHHLHNNSSEDEGYLEADQGMSENNAENISFAGFSSPESFIPIALSNSSDRRLKRVPLDSSSEEGGLVGLELGKRRSHDSLRSVDGTKDEDLLTPNKRKYEPQQREYKDIIVAPRANKTPTALADQVIAVDSDSTFHSQRNKRMQRRCQHINNQHFNQYIKCATETSSEFPLSSPSNPHPGGTENQLVPRQPPLKNNSTIDFFEVQLAIIVARNPQMTLSDKISSWKCDAELSDVEDVNEFDALFQRCEDIKHRSLRARKRKTTDYDFSQFREVLKSLKPANTFSNTSTMQHSEDYDKPTTSAAAALQLRRQEKKTRPPKEQRPQKKNDQSSTTPGPATSSSYSSYSIQPSSEGFYPITDNVAPQKNNSLKLHVHEHLLCPSSSSDGFHPIGPVKNNPNLQIIKREPKEAVIKTTPTKRAGTDSIKTVEPLAKVNLSSVDRNIPWPPTEGDSVFKLNRLNREINKSTEKWFTPNSPRRLIEMHYDFLPEKKDLNLREKKGEIFKTPCVPVKCVTEVSPHAVHNNDDAIFKESNLSPLRVDLAKDVVDDNDAAKQKPVPSSESSDPVDDTWLQPLEGLHKQHEFCNYLGLTGLSTANAVADAVADLARSNIARRSLRVRHLKHEQEKNQKRLQELKSLKTKQLREIKRSQKPLKYKKEKEEKFKSSMGPLGLNDPALNKEMFQKNMEKLAQVVLPVPKKEPKIKIVCRITADDKTDPSDNSITNTADPIKNTLFKDLRIKKPEKLPIDDGRSLLTRGAHSTSFEMSNQETINSTDEGNGILNTTEGRLIEKLSTFSSSTTQEFSQTHIDCAGISPPKVCLQRLGPTTYNNAMDRSVMSQNNLYERFQEYLKVSRCSKPSIFIVQSIDSNKEINPPFDPGFTAEEDNVARVMCAMKEKIAASTEADVIGASVSPMAEQLTLEEQHLNDFETACALVDLHNSDSCLVSPPVIVKYDEPVQENDLETFPSQPDIPKSEENNLRRKNKNSLGRLLTRSVLNMSSHRQLRNRKIVVLKTFKRKLRAMPTMDRKFKKKLLNKKVKERISSHLLKLHGRRSTTTASFRKKALFKKREIPMSPGAAELPVEGVDKSSVVSYAECAGGSPIASIDESCAESPNAVYSTPMPLIGSAGADVLTALFKEQQPLISSVEKGNQSSPVPPKPGADNELVVVSSTTNCYDEHATKDSSKTNILDGDPSKDGFANDNNSVYTKDMATQYVVEPSNRICELTPPSRPLKNPLKAEYGKVLYIYYELDVLIVVQEMLVSFWKYSNFLNVLNVQAMSPNELLKQQLSDHYHQQNKNSDAEPSLPTFETLGEWHLLGSCQRSQIDLEIAAPYANRICIHNTIPIYVELRCKELQKDRRSCNLLSMYINIYFYDESSAKRHSIQLDSVQSCHTKVIFTTISDSRYFIMSWSQENILNKMRSGLCKYSITPSLDTLASIRDFRSLRHEIFYLECTDDGKLFGLGPMQVTIWDHRTGDVLFNYDMEIKIGRNLGSIYYKYWEVGQNSMLLLFQLVANANDVEHMDSVCADSESASAAGQAEFQVIACNVSHLSPSHRVVFRHILPGLNFAQLKRTINTGEYIVVIASNNEEIWINCSDPKQMIFLPAQNSERFYVRGRSQVIELTEDSLVVNRFAAHLLKIAAVTAEAEM